jgi:hypothetical protein
MFAGARHKRKSLAGRVGFLRDSVAENATALASVPTSSDLHFMLVLGASRQAEFGDMLNSSMI